MNIAKIKKIKLILSIIFVSIMLLVFTFLFIDMYHPFMDMIKNNNIEPLEHYFEKFGFWGPFFLSLTNSFQVLLAILPGEPIQLLSGICYGPYTGFMACLTGIMLGNFIIYLLVRKLGSNFVLLFKSKDVKKISDVSMDRGASRLTWLILILYFLPAIPYGLIAFLATSTKMKFPKYMIITSIGVIPSIASCMFLSEMLKAGNMKVSIIVIVVLLLISVLSIKYYKKIFNFVMKGDKHEESNGEVQK